MTKHVARSMVFAAVVECCLLKQRQVDQILPSVCPVHAEQAFEHWIARSSNRRSGINALLAESIEQTDDARDSPVPRLTRSIVEVLIDRAVAMVHESAGVKQSIPVPQDEEVLVQFVSKRRMTRPHPPV